MLASFCITFGCLVFASAQSTTYRAIPTLSSSINAAPAVIPNIRDPTAPNSQDLCPGYKATNLAQTAAGFTADLDLAGSPCNTYGFDIPELSLLVEYQTQQRLHVQITPRHIAPSNYSQYMLSPDFTGYPDVLAHDANDLSLTWTNTPSFQFEITRSSSKEVLFSTYGTVIVFQDQFLEVITSMVADYNIYGLAEHITNFRLHNDLNVTFYAADSGNQIDANIYGTHPMYLETRYANDTSLSHGVYGRNAHGQEWLLRDDHILYRTLGGSLDFYFLSGPHPKDVIAQYQAGIVGTPAMQMYWTLGFHQCRWGYANWSVLQDVVDNYRSANIPLEVIWTDIDYMDQYRDFTNGEMNFPVAEGEIFLANLAASNQHYVPIIDSNIYAPNPTNASDSYEPFARGESLNAFIRNGDEGLYYGDNWPGFSVWADWVSENAQAFWTYEITNWYKSIPFSGIWIDLNEASSFCAGSCGTGELDENPVHPPFQLPGELNNVDYSFPESFNATNATEAASATAASIAQASTRAASAAAASAASPTVSSSAAVTISYTAPTPGSQNLNFPPYAINNIQGALERSAISPNATHNDPYNTTEYVLHNLFGHQILNATYNALLQVFPGARPFLLGRSTFAGSGSFASHWGGDNTSKWGSMALAISQALQNAIAGLAMFGVDTCGFAGNTDYELCSRWMEMSAFFPFYRNHNVFAAISQEAYVWSSVAESSRRAMSIRYSLLPYMYTLFYNAHTQAETVMRALAWEFPNDASLAAVETQFMLGPDLLITPVLEPLVTSVRGVFPGVADGTIWYDWYTLQPVDVAAGQNLTLDAPLEKINVHIRSGSVLPLQQPGYTTVASRANPFNLLITLDKFGGAAGSLYLDDGFSLVPNATKNVQFNFWQNRLTTKVLGAYNVAEPLANITIAGLAAAPSAVYFGSEECYANGNHGHPAANGVQTSFADGVLHITGLEALTAGGAYKDSWELNLVPGYAQRGPHSWGPLGGWHWQASGWSRGPPS